MADGLIKRCGCPAAKWAKCAHSWHVKKQTSGQRIRIALDEWLGHDKVRLVADAERWRDEIVRTVRAGTFSPLGPTTPLGQQPAPREATGWTMREVVATYDGAVTGNPEHGATYDANLRSRFKAITDWPVPTPTRTAKTLGDLPIGAVTSALLEQFYAGLVTRGLANSTRNKYLQDLRAFGRWAQRKGYRATIWLDPDDDDTKVRRRKAAQRHRRLARATVDDHGVVVAASEEDRLLAVARRHVHDLIIAALESGARLGELLRLTWGDVDRPRRAVRIRDLKDPDGATVRILPLSTRLAGVLAMRATAPDGQELPPTAFVFGNAVGEPVASISTAWETTVLKAQGHDVTRDPKTHALTPASRAAYRAADLVFHDLRHEAGSRWHEAGWPLTQIRDMLGHTSIETTQIYLNVRAGDLAAQMAAYDASRAAAAAQADASATAPPAPVSTSGRRGGVATTH